MFWFKKERKGKGVKEKDSGSNDIKSEIGEEIKWEQPIDDEDVISSLGEHGKRLKLLYRFINEISKLWRKQEILRHLAKYCHELFKDASYILFFDVLPDGSVKPLFGIKKGDEKLREDIRPHSDYSVTIVNKALHERTGYQWLPNPLHESSASIKITGIRSVLCAPIASRDSVFGLVQVDKRASSQEEFENFPESRHFTKDELQTLVIFSNFAGMALESSMLLNKVEESFEYAVSALCSVIEVRDSGTAVHCIDVAHLSKRIGERLGLNENEEEMETLHLAALLHDIGKVGIPDAILIKEGPLTDEERDGMKKHVLHTQRILNQINFPQKYLEEVPWIAACHHERMDGSGPLGLVGDAIPFLSRIIAVADVFSALVHPRIYKQGLSVREAMEIIEKERYEGKLDSRVVGALREVVYPFE